MGCFATSSDTATVRRLTTARFLRTVLPLAAVLTTHQASAQQCLSYQDLGTLGGDRSEVTAISPEGEVAGYGADASGNIRGFYLESRHGRVGHRRPVGRSERLARLQRPKW